MDPVIRSRLTAWLHRENLAGALLSSPFSVDWASGHETAIETGPNPFAGGPSLLLVEPDSATLFHPDCEAPDLAALNLRGLAYPSYTPANPFDPAARLLEKTRELLAGKNLPALGVEFASLPIPLAELLRGARAIDGALSALRAVKTPTELTALRASLALCDHAQAILPALVRPGRTELAIWGDLRADLESRAGRRLPLLADFVSGPRTAEIGGPPTNRVVAAGEWLLADIVPRLGNYWGDICGVIPAGEPTPRFFELRKLVSEALDLAISLVRPGAIPEEIDRATRAFFASRGLTPYPHHTGHGIGVCYHEEPRIVAGNRTPLAENMVIALEPGLYLPGEGGVRLEDVVLVTASGCEVLTHHRRPGARPPSVA
jgi:Xaa-Pro aminopeptidase